MVKKTLIISLYLLLFGFKTAYVKEITFGQSAFLSHGSLQIYGELIRNGITARFNRNKLKLISKDDEGNPEKSNANIKHFLANGINMFFGNTGTRSILQELSLIRQGKIAMFFPWGGDKKLRDPKLTNIINGPGYVRPQIDAIVSYIVNVRKLKNIALFFDDSTFGKDNKLMAIQALKKYGMTPIASASYNRFTMDIKTPAEKLLKLDPKVVICMATSTPTTKLINTFFEHGHFGTTFIGIDSTMLVGEKLERKGVDFLYASQMPNPKTSKLKIVQEYRNDTKKYFPHDPLNILSLSYYIYAAIIEKAIQKISVQVTKEKIIQQIEQMKQYNLDGFIVDFDPNTRLACNRKIEILKG